MVTHEKCHGVSDVEKFLNDAGLHLDQVQIVYGSAGRCGGSYYVFYEVEKPAPQRPTRPPAKLVEEKFEPKALLGDNGEDIGAVKDTEHVEDKT